MVRLGGAGWLISHNGFLEDFLVILFTAKPWGGRRMIEFDEYFFEMAWQKKTTNY